MRSVHFISFAWFVLFILAHGIMVFVTGLRQNTNHMFGGVDNASWAGFPLFVLAMARDDRRLAPRIAVHDQARAAGAANRRGS